MAMFIKHPSEFSSMVVIPKQRRTYCPHCKKHTLHKVEKAKLKTMGSAHPQSRGKRAQRRHMATYGNHGRYSMPPIGRRRMFGRKSSKKVDLRYACTVCNKQHIAGTSTRAKKVEFK